MIIYSGFKWEHRMWNVEFIIILCFESIGENMGFKLYRERMGDELYFKKMKEADEVCLFLMHSRSGKMLIPTGEPSSVLSIENNANKKFRDTLMKKSSNSHGVQAASL